MVFVRKQSFGQYAANGSSEPIVPVDEWCSIRREGRYAAVRLDLHQGLVWETFQ